MKKIIIKHGGLPPSLANGASVIALPKSYAGPSFAKASEGRQTALGMGVIWFCCFLLFAFHVGAQETTNVLNDAGTNTLSPRLTTGSSYVMDDKHVLEPGDKLSFQILEDRDPPIVLTVTDSRELDVPYIGRVAVSEKTCKQLAAALKTPLEKEYYFRATVIVGLDLVNKVRGRVYVAGQVRNTGPLDMFFGQNLTVAKAILRAGGFSEFANKKKVRIIRGTEKKVIEVNMVDVLDNGKTDLDAVLQPEDFIVVPSRLVNF